MFKNNSVLATARHQIQQMKERSKAELKQALEDLLEGEDGVSVSACSVNIVCSSLLDHSDIYKQLLKNLSTYTTGRAVDSLFYACT